MKKIILFLIFILLIKISFSQVDSIITTCYKIQNVTKNKDNNGNDLFTNYYIKDQKFPIFFSHLNKTNKNIKFYDEDFLICNFNTDTIHSFHLERIYRKKYVSEDGYIETYTWETKSNVPYFEDFESNEFIKFTLIINLQTPNLYTIIINHSLEDYKDVHFYYIREEIIVYKSEILEIDKEILSNFEKIDKILKSKSVKTQKEKAKNVKNRAKI
jgi:hypothetical protein